MPALLSSRRAIGFCIHRKIFYANWLRHNPSERVFRQSMQFARHSGLGGCILHEARQFLRIQVEDDRPAASFHSRSGPSIEGALSCGQWEGCLFLMWKRHLTAVRELPIPRLTLVGIEYAPQTDKAYSCNLVILLILSKNGGE